MSLPRLLCVDDDADVLEGLELSLGRDFAVSTALGAKAGLARIAAEPDFEVVISDMRMPEMDGVRFLATVRAQSPDSSRILLTGFAEMDAAIAAVNEGGISRYLTKPCPPELLRRAVHDGVASYRSLQAEHQLLEQTLRGAVEALVEALSSAEPLLFGQARRVQQLCRDLAQTLGLRPHWSLEVAALVSNLGLVGVPGEVLSAQLHGAPLTPAMSARIGRRVEEGKRILAKIPRMEPVVALLEQADVLDRAREPLLPGNSAAQVLAVAVAAALFEARGGNLHLAAAVLREQHPAFAADCLEALSRVLGDEGEQARVTTVPLSGLVAGMVLVEPLYTASGRLLAPAGFEISAGFIERALALKPGSLRLPLRVRWPTPLLPE